MKIFKTKPNNVMMYFILILCSLIPFLKIEAQSKLLNHSVFTISNIVDIDKNSEFESRITKLLVKQTSPFTFIINGDLVSSKFKKNFTKDSIRIKNLLTHLSKFKLGRFIIIPGDRDWDDSGKNGLKNVKKLEKLVKSLKLNNVKWAIKNGCPGPKDFEINENLLLITINTQWWNHPYDVPGPVDGDCKISTTDDFQEELEDIINESPDKNIIIAGHYPIISNGEYGGHLPFHKHIFPLTEISKSLYVPLPILGSFYSSFRENIGTTKDIENERFEDIRKLIENVISDNNSIIYLSGHEKTQQIVEINNNYFINSGAPEKASYANNIEGSILSKSKPGIIEIIYHTDGSVTSKFHQFKKNNEIKETHLTLFESACKYPENKLPVNYSFIPCQNMSPTKEKMTNSFPKTVKAIAGPEYAAGPLKRFFMGDHYRDSWTQEVEVPYLNLDTTWGGLTVLKKGGGRQTLSLKLQGNNGIRYTFRSVNKDPIKALDYELRKTALAKVVKDQTTTQHPYGAMAADILLNNLDIIHAHPVLYVMPDDEKLGPFQRDFGNMLGMLEENPANPPKGKLGYLGATQILRSNKLFRKLYNDHNNRVNSKRFAVARSFDILVGDWGKHDDNWKWVGFKKNNKTIFEPMPRDRDHVFSRWDGVFPWLADREWAKESGEDFDYKISGLRSLMFQARHLDRFIASELSKQDWLEAAKYVQSRISEKVIETAVKNMPKEIYNLSGNEIENKLKIRIKDLDKYVLEYYEMLSPEVDIIGSNKNEFFDIRRDEDESVTVNMYNIKNNSKGNDILYSRKFLSDETDDIRIYGLGGRDIFEIKGKSNNSIRLRIIGGSGKDSINDASNQETLVYDKGKKTKINKGEKTKIVTPYYKDLYKYNRTNFAYNTYFPLPYISYGADDGFIFSLGVDFVNHNFDKEDFSSKHNIRITGSSHESYGINYSGRFHHVFYGWDILLSGHFDEPKPYTYFFGFGNETIKDNDKFNNDYYRTRFASRGLTIGFAKEFWKKSSLIISAKYENDERQEQSALNIITNSSIIGKDRINIIEGTASLNLDFRNRSTLPSTGTKFYAEYNNGFVENLDYVNFGKLLLLAESYISIPKILPLTLGLKVGGGRSFGKIPFYNQFKLGQNNFLKGFRNNRFTGNSIAFAQSELRLNVFDIEGTFVPLKIGLLGFFNTGRVFQRGESSSKWHNGYGGGFYIVPLREEITIYSTVSFSDEESLLVELGIGSTL